MAREKSKAKNSNRRQATQHEKAVLKAAKARGLTTIDLRKPLSRYARSLVSKFESVYRQEASVVSIPKGARKGLKGVKVVRGKAIVEKQTIDEVARFDKKSGRISVRDTKRGTTRRVGASKSMRTRTRIVFREGTSRRRVRTYTGVGAGVQAAKYLASYDDDILADSVVYEEAYDAATQRWFEI